MERIVRLARQAPELHYLASGLNGLREGRRDNELIWKGTEQIILGMVKEKLPRRGRTILSDWMAGVGKPSLKNAQRNFHWLSKQYPVELTIDLKRTPKGVLAVPAVRAHESKSHSGLGVAHLHILWKRFFGEGGYERLKTCQRCGDWFVDLGRNKQAVYCSPSCRTRWWSRGQRRTAGHLQYRKSPDTKVKIRRRVRKG